MQLTTYLDMGVGLIKCSVCMDYCYSELQPDSSNYICSDVHGTTTTTFENGSFTTHVSRITELKVDCPNVTTIVRGDLPTSPIPQAADQPYVAVSVPQDVNPAAPSSQQSDDWDIPKAIVYGGLVESVTSLSVVSAAASSGAKTCQLLTFTYLHDEFFAQKKHMMNALF